jgi:hypothetical protein
MEARDQARTTHASLDDAKSAQSDPNPKPCNPESAQSDPNPKPCNPESAQSDPNPKPCNPESAQSDPNPKPCNPESAQSDPNLEPENLKICLLQLGPAAPTAILRPAEWWARRNIQFLVRALQQPEKYWCGSDLVVWRRRRHVNFWNFVQSIQTRGTRRHCFRGIRSHASCNFGLDFDLPDRS